MWTNEVGIISAFADASVPTIGDVFDFKQSGVGREGGTEGLLPFLETKTVILEAEPTNAL
jgi:acyl-CoA reductase-like NAD-dependent aldehyde dehydrogenase